MVSSLHLVATARSMESRSTVFLRVLFSTVTRPIKGRHHDPCTFKLQINVVFIILHVCTGLIPPKRNTRMLWYKIVYLCLLTCWGVSAFMTHTRYVTILKPSQTYDVECPSKHQSFPRWIMPSARLK
ncbi:hypothetical protein EDB19DRAFT_1179969 [Suillus lakei]|nr:hypothetical protein EDB19DRAFT_1179969 [Suillus lakei]